MVNINQDYLYSDIQLLIPPQTVYSFLKFFGLVIYNI